MKLYVDKLRAIRKSKKLTIEELAHKIGYNRVTLNSWENEKRVPSEAKIRMLANALSVKVNEISDIKPDQPVSDIKYSDAMESWNSVKNQQIDKIQRDEFDIALSCIGQMKKKVNDLNLIIDGVKSSIYSMFYVKDTNLKYITANDLFLENLSLKKGFSVMNKTDIDFFPISESKINEEQDNNILLTGKQIEFEGYIPGSRRKKWGIISKKPVLDSVGKILGVVGSFIDITERKKSERLREILETNIDLMRDCVWIQSKKDLEVIYINKAFEDVYGYSTDKIRDINFWYENCVHPADIDKEREYGRMNSWPKVREFRIINSDGEVLLLESYFHEVSISGKECYFFINRDITKQRSDQNNLKDFNDAVLSSGDVLWIGKYTDNGLLKYSYLGGDTINILGYSRVDLLNEPECWKKNVHPLDREKLEKWIEIKSYPKELNCRLILNGEVKWLYLRICFNNNILYGCIYNITISKKEKLINFILEQSLYNANIMIWIQNVNGKLLLYTGSPEKLYGKSFENINDPLQFWYEEILNEDSRKEYDRIAGLYGKNSEEYLSEFVDRKNEFNYNIKKTNGERAFLKAITTYIYYEGEPYFITFDSDVTEKYTQRKKLEYVSDYFKKKKILSPEEKKVLEVIAKKNWE
jgi:PAS domain S-box-containing protein